MVPFQEEILASIRGANGKLAEIELDPYDDFYTQGLDSLDHVQILLKIETDFGVVIDETAYDDCVSVERIGQFILRLRAPGGAT